MDGHEQGHELSSDHEHVDDLTVRRVGWAHDHHDAESARQRRTAIDHPGNDIIVYAWDADQRPAAVLSGSATIVRTVNHWNPDGSINFPCQFGYHAELKYNVVQLHHKWPVGLGGPAVDLKEELCNWNYDAPGLGACGMHHDDTHLLWRLLGKALRPLEPFRLLPGMRRQFGLRVIEAVEQGWNIRINWVESNQEGAI